MMKRTHGIISLIAAGAWLATPAFAAQTQAQTQAQTNAEAETASSSQSQSQPTPPHEVARNTVETLLAEMEDRRDEFRNNPQQLYAMINRELVPLVDMRYMSERVLGKAWDKATPAQRERFTDAFQVMLVRSYGDALLEFDNETIIYEPVENIGDRTDIDFKATVVTESGDEYPVTLDLHRVDNQWKVYDGTLGSLSLVSNYRGQFNALVRSRGLDTTIELLEKRYGSGS